MQKFGIGDDDTNLLAFIFDSDPEATKKLLLDAVEGDVKSDLSELGSLTDVPKICKYHKLIGSPVEAPDQRERLVDLLISRVASKDIGLRV